MNATRTTPLRERMRQDLQLAGLSARTEEAYLRAVRQLANHFRCPPDRITEEQLRDYFLRCLTLNTPAPAGPLPYPPLPSTASPGFLNTGLQGRLRDLQSLFR